MGNEYTLYFAKHLVWINHKFMGVMQNNGIEAIRGKGELIEFALRGVVSQGVAAMPALHTTIGK